MPRRLIGVALLALSLAGCFAAADSGSAGYRPYTAVARFVPGVVGDEQSVVEDSFSRGLLDFPQFTRPPEIAALRVPDVLLSGNHAEIRRWRKRAALSRTLERRPDLLDDAMLDDEERQMLRELKGVRHGRD